MKAQFFLNFQIKCKCVHSCQVLSIEYRNNLWQTFHDLKKYKRQQNFSKSYIRPEPVKRRRNKSQSDSIRNKSVKYFIPVLGGQTVQVCRAVFLDTFGIDKSRVNLIANKVFNGELDIGDGRGGCRRGDNKIYWKQKIKEHINSFPTETGHYNRSDAPNRRYLSSDLNISMMYREFLKNYCDSETNAKPNVSRRWYSDIFNKDFNLSFKQPRTDTCATCDRLNITMTSSSCNEKEAANKASEEHHEEVNKSRKQLKEDINSLSYCVSFDLEQQISIPTLTHGAMYYSRQLSCSNLGIHDEIISRGIMCVWPEYVGGRGSNKIGTCLWDYFSKMSTDKRSLILWSDNCGGQNKNQFILAVYMTLIAKGYFDEVIILSV